jgi:ABC-type thiamin/hydroxymethylpyrimidine transport system permease subunit
VKGTPLAIGLVVLAVVFAIVGALYYEGVIQILVSDPTAKHHTTHAILFGVLAIASLVGANFARPKPA